MSESAEVQLRWGIRIPLRDGVQLSAILYLPALRKDPVPAIFLMTPYSAQTHHDRASYFAGHGFPFLSVDMRGRGNSGDEFQGYGGEAEDTYDIVEWLAQQPYCNGKVAMHGGSYNGFVQWAAASARPPHLATIVPVAAPFRGLDSPMRNNIFAPYRLQWLTLVAGRTSQDKIFADQRFWCGQFRRWFESGRPFAETDRLLGLPPPLLQRWLAHPHLDEYWDRLNPSAEQYALVSIPVLTITGIYDSDQPGALEHYRRHLEHNPQACHYLVIGPWHHAGTHTPQLEFYGLKVGPSSLIDLSKLHADWYAWTMQGGEKPAFLKKKVVYYVMGAERWRYAETLEAITARSQPLFLHSAVNPTDVFDSGFLVPEPPDHSGLDYYSYDPRDMSLVELESTVDPYDRADQRMLLASRGRCLIYHSAPFNEDIEVSGFFKLIVWIAIDQPDTDFRVSIHEVGLYGSAVELTNDVMRARYRESLREEKLIRTTEPLRYAFERFLFASRQVKAGSRLRLVIGPINSIYGQKNYNSGGVVADETMHDARVVTVKVFHDEAHPSALYVPYGQTER